MHVHKYMALNLMPTLHVKTRHLGTKLPNLMTANISGYMVSGAMHELFKRVTKEHLSAHTI